MLAPLLDDSPEVFIHDAISPARAEADVGFVILVLVDHLVCMPLAGIAPSMGGGPLTVPDAVDLNKVITPSHFDRLLPQLLPGRRSCCTSL